MEVASEMGADESDSVAAGLSSFENIWLGGAMEGELKRFVELGS